MPTIKIYASLRRHVIKTCLFDMHALRYFEFESNNCPVECYTRPKRLVGLKEYDAKEQNY